MWCALDHAVSCCPQIPKDWQLFIGVCVMVLCVAIYLSAVAIFGNYGATLVSDKERRVGRDVSCMSGDVSCAGISWSVDTGGGEPGSLPEPDL